MNDTAVTEHSAFRETRFAASPTMSLSVREFGDREAPGVPFVALHGFWRTSRDFEELAVHLAPGRFVVTPDLRGRGRSDRSTNVADYAIERLIEDVGALLRERGVERAVFLGTALGAIVAMRLALQRPELAAGFVFNDTAPEFPRAPAASGKTFSGADSRTFDEALALIREQNEAGFTRYGDAEWDKMTRRAYWQQPDGRWVRDFDQLTNDDIPRMMAATPDFWDEYRAIRAPILILRGENSHFVPPETAQRMVEANKRAELATIPGCGHPPMLWEPESFAAIDAFLARIDG